MHVIDYQIKNNIQTISNVGNYASKTMVLGAYNVRVNIAAREQVEVDALQKAIDILPKLSIEHIQNGLKIMELLQKYNVTPEDFTNCLNALYTINILGK